MMARYRVHPAITLLIRTFAPGGDARLLRGCATRLGKRGETVVITYDLPDAEACAAAEKLVRQASSLRLTTVGGKAIREIGAAVDGNVLGVAALLTRDGGGR